MPILKNLYDWLHPKPEEPETSTSETKAEAEDAVKRAITDLHDIIERQPMVSNLVSKSKDQLERNHFGELVEASMRGRG